MATQILMRNPNTLEERFAYEGYSWTSLCFGGFPTLLRGDIGIGVLLIVAQVAIALGAFMAGLPTFFGPGIVGGVWGFFYNDYHRNRLLRQGYVPVAAAVVAPAPEQGDVRPPG